MALERIERNQVIGTVQTPVTGVTYVRWGQLIIVTVDKDITTNGGSWVEVCSNLPRSAYDVYNTVQPNELSDNRMILMNVGANGKLQVKGAGTTTAKIRGSITYITKD